MVAYPRPFVLSQTPLDDSGTVITNATNDEDYLPTNTAVDFTFDKPVSVEEPGPVDTDQIQVSSNEVDWYNCLRFEHGPGNTVICRFSPDVGVPGYWRCTGLGSPYLLASDPPIQDGSGQVDA